MIVPEWQGWAALGALMTGFVALAWWLFASPIDRPVASPSVDSRQVAARRTIGLLMLLSAAAMALGARWDELWHRMYGGFGDDFLWPPHLIMYAALGANGLFAGFGLGIALRGRGSIRERVRQDPLLGFVGLLAAYQMASIPSDALWHAIIGPDLTAWSPPHALLTLTTNAAAAAAIALLLSTAPAQPWRRITEGLRPLDLGVLGLLVAADLFLLQFTATEWEWTDAGRLSAGVASRPDWAYPVAVLAAGVLISHLALHATRLVGAATGVAVLALIVQVALNAVMRVYHPPGPALISHLLLVGPAIALDVWYAAAWRHLARPRALLLRACGAVIYAAVFLAAAVPFLSVALPEPRLDWDDRLAAVLIGCSLAVAVALAASRFGQWLSELGSVTRNAVAPRGHTYTFESVQMAEQPPRR